MRTAFLIIVIAGLDPAIHVRASNLTSSFHPNVDARVKPGHDGLRRPFQFFFSPTKWYHRPMEATMTVKPTISLTDQAHEFARSLVDQGKFASLSAVVQHGLQLIKREEEEHHVRIDAIRADLDRRAETPSMSTKEMDEQLAIWRMERRSA